MCHVYILLTSIRNIFITCFATHLNKVQYDFYQNKLLKYVKKCM